MNTLSKVSPQYFGYVIQNDDHNHKSSFNSSSKAVEVAFDYGRVIHCLGICYFIIGRKEINQCREKSIDISIFNGLHVALNSSNNKILSIFRDVKLSILHHPTKHYYRSKYDSY